MGIGYVILGLVLGIVIIVVLDVSASAVSSSATQGTQIGVSAIVGDEVVPFGALAGLIVTIPVYTLFVYDKNAGVLEYLLAVGMTQRDVFAGYLRAAFMLSLVGIVPMVLTNVAISTAGIGQAAIVGCLAAVTSLADVALVTVLMTAFSSMQRRPSGMNSPLGISIGIFFLLPELILGAALGSVILWLDLAIAVALLVTALALLSSLDKLILREKLLP